MTIRHKGNDIQIRLYEKDLQHVDELLTYAPAINTECWGKCELIFLYYENQELGYLDYKRFFTNYHNKRIMKKNPILNEFMRRVAYGFPTELDFLGGGEY